MKDCLTPPALSQPPAGGSWWRLTAPLIDKESSCVVNFAALSPWSGESALTLPGILSLLTWAGQKLCLFQRPHGNHSVRSDS